MRLEGRDYQMVNVKKLREKMREKGWNVEKLSKAIGIDKSTFYRKLNNNGFRVYCKRSRYNCQCFKINL